VRNEPQSEPIVGQAPWLRSDFSYENIFLDLTGF